jgi:lipopolysaccharide/colanic/teichoic acid biosynthesis glycosyltransferase
LLALSVQDGPAFKMHNDPRVTRVGWFLRRTSIDELPQLWNVLRGDMSLVGPRPLPCGETAATNAWHLRRLDVAPGITCTWQIRGRLAVSFDQWMRMDIQYARTRSLFNDLKLLVQTIPVVLLCRGSR